MTLLIYLGVTFFLFVTLLLYLSSTQKHQKKQDKIENDVRNKTLAAIIEQKVQRLNELNEQIENQTFNRQQQLTAVEIRALNIYDDSNIRIPSDIIEDLHNARLDNEKDILCFIENQRYYWKLENQKKPFTVFQK